MLHQTGIQIQNFHDDFELPFLHTTIHGKKKSLMFETHEVGVSSSKKIED